MLDNLNSYKPENEGTADDNAKNVGKTFLEFEISEEAPSATEPLTVTDDTKKTEPVRESAAEPKEEFRIPDSFDVNEMYASENFVQTPSAIRPTYLPRFTEVSETYRMQNDPRPRPKTDTHNVKASADNSSALELDPTTEKVEEKDVEKVLVTSKVIRSSEPTDETLKVLKFSTPIDSETADASAVPEKSEPVIPEPTVSEPENEEEVDIPVETVAEPIVEKPKNMTIPDPDATFSVVDFTPHELELYEEPKGASEPEKKEKGLINAEFTSPIQRDSVKDRFLDTLMSIKVRLAGSLILLLVMILMDCLPYLGVDVLGAIGFGNIPHAGAIIDMQFSICIFLFALPEILRSFKLLVKGKLTPELFSVVSLIFVIINDLVAASFLTTNYLTFGVLHGLQCVGIIVASYNRTVSDFTSFKLVSRNVAKNVLDKRLTRELPRENLALDGAIDEYNSKTARMFRTVFVSNFFKRASESCENFVNVAMMMGITFGLAVVSGLVTFFLDSYSVASGMQTATLVILLGLPVFSILAHKLPYRHACRNAATEESAFVGESSIYDGADVDVFTYEDTEIFGIEDVSLRKVHLYGKVYNTPKAMKQMYALFSVVGGPLDFLFSSALDRKCPPADDVVIEENGVSGMLEGRKVCAGTEEYMISHGIAIPDDDYRTNPAANDSTKVMYGAEDGEVYVKFFIRYSFSEEFTMLLPEFKDKKIVPLIYTRDPNITDELLKVLTLGEDMIRVMKKYVPRSTEEKTYRRIDSGIVTHGDKGNAINMVLLAKRYASFQGSIASAELISMMIGAVLAVVLSLGHMTAIPATLLALWQGAWCTALYIRSRLFFRHRPEREEE